MTNPCGTNSHLFFSGLQSKSVSSCPGSLPSFYLSDLRSRNDGQRGLSGQPVYHPDRSVPKFLCLRPHSTLSQLSPVTCLRNLLHKSSLVGKLSLMVGLNTPWPRNQRNLRTLRILACYTVFIVYRTHSVVRQGAFPVHTPAPITARPRYFR